MFSWNKLKETRGTCQLLSERIGPSPILPPLCPPLHPIPPSPWYSIGLGNKLLRNPGETPTNMSQTFSCLYVLNVTSTGFSLKIICPYSHWIFLGDTCGIPASHFAQRQKALRVPTDATCSPRHLTEAARPGNRCLTSSSGVWVNPCYINCGNIPSGSLRRLKSWPPVI